MFNLDVMDFALYLERYKPIHAFAVMIGKDETCVAIVHSIVWVLLIGKNVNPHRTIFF